MSESIYKVVEIVGTSTISSDDAIRNAIARASETLDHLDWYEVLENRGSIRDGKLAEFQVALKAGFRLEARR